MSRNEGYWKDLVNILIFWILLFYIEFKDIIVIIMNDGFDLGVD